MSTFDVTVRVDLSRVAANAQSVRRRSGVGLIAVLKADAYGLGAVQVARALRGLVDGFYFFDLSEIASVRSAVDFDVDVIVLRGDEHPADRFLENRARPVVWTIEAARDRRAARPVLSVDTGQQRFGCPVDQVDDILNAGAINEAMTHATQPDQARKFDDATRHKSLRRHAAGTALLDVPAARFDAVRPGLALYEDSVTVTTHLIDARASVGPVGYSRFNSTTGRHGVIPVGYSHGLRPGPCLVETAPARIVEVGMQTAFVELPRDARAGDRVTLLGGGVALHDVASAWRASPQETLLRLCSLTPSRDYTK